MTGDETPQAKSGGTPDLVESDSIYEALDKLADEMKLPGTNITRNWIDIVDTARTRIEALASTRPVATQSIIRLKHLESRLARHECVEHDPPRFGECGTCDGFNQDESWRNVDP